MTVSPRLFSLMVALMLLHERTTALMVARPISRFLQRPRRLRLSNNSHDLISTRTGYIKHRRKDLMRLGVAPVRRNKQAVASVDDIIASSSPSITSSGGVVEQHQQQQQETVPTTLSEAIRVFFLDRYHGPPLVAVSLLAVSAWRCCLACGHPLVLSDAMVAGLMVILWWFQEHAMHGHLLHSKFDWYGKTIHANHHRKPYHHISIDPAGLMLGWLLAAHVLFRCLLPLPLALSATVGYAGAGLFYEWAHFIVHTKVRFRKKESYWQRMKDNHIRHHLVDSKYWLGFSLPAIDDLFGTNPNVKEIRQKKREAR